MALTKVTGDFIKAGSITQGHLHSSHGITTSHITEGDKLFFTNARVDSRVGSLSTSNLSEGTNLYYTNARARAAISVSGNALSYNSSTGVITSNFEESPTFSGNVVINGSGSSGHVFYVTRGSDGAVAFRITNTGEVVSEANYFYASASGVSMYVQNTAVFRGSILNDGSNAPVRIADDLTIDDDLTVTGGDITLGGTGRIQGIDTVSAGTDAANKTYVDNQVAGIVASAPSTLDTLNELAAALGDDANFSTTVTNSIALKAPLASPTFTGSSHFTGNVEVGDGTDISMDSSSNGQLMIDGNGYQGAIALDDQAMHIYHNSSSRSLVLGTNETARLTITGGGNATFTGTITASGYNDSNWNTAYGWGNHASAGYLTSFDITTQTDSKYLRSNAADSASHRVSFDGCSTSNHDTIATSTGSLGSIEIYNNGSGNDAFMAFHTGGDFALYFGLDAGTNKLSVGGWSMGAASYEIYHAGNKPSLATLGYTGATNANYITNNNQLTNGAGYLTSLPSHNHDDRYYTESEMQTFFNRGYINNHGATNGAAGWYTIATNTGDRALGEFQIWDTASGDHQSVLFSASHHFGMDTSNDITVLANSRYSGTNFRYIRIKEGGTYDGAVLQVYIDGSSNTVYAAIVGGNAQESGWVLKDWIADGTDPGDVSSYSSMTERTKVDLDSTVNGGIMTTGPIYSGGQTTQYRVLNTSDEGSGNGLDADTLDGQHASAFQAAGSYAPAGGSYGTDWYANNLYHDEWVRNHTNSNGHYWESTGWHLYPRNSEFFYLRSGLSTSTGLAMVCGNETIRGYVYADSGSNIGLLNNVGQWTLQCDNSKNVTAHGSSRAPIFYDSSDTNYYTNPNDTSIIRYLGRRFHQEGLLVGGYNNIGQSHSKTNPIFTIGSSYLPSESSLGGMYGIGYARGDASFISATNGWGMYVAADGDARIFLDGQNGGVGTALASWRAPIFYDSNNTAYYVNPADNSEFSTATFNLNANSTISLVAAGTNASQIKAGAGDELYLGGNNTWQMRLSGGNILMDNGGYAQMGTTGSMRAPLFYDSNDTTYYLDPANGGKFKGNFEFAATDTATGYSTASIELRESNYTANNTATPPYIGFHWGGVVASNIAIESNGRIAIRNNPGNAYEKFIASIVYGSSDVRAPIFYDSNDTSYHVNPAGLSDFYSIKTTSSVDIAPRWDTSFYVAQSQHYYGHTSTQTMYLGEANHINIRNIADIHGQARAPIYYDRNNTAYYMHPDSTSVIVGLTMAGALQTAGSITAGSSGTSNIYMGGVSGNYFRFHTNNSHTYFDGNVGDIHWRQGSSTRFTFYMTSANMTINGSLTQNSDERVKENIVEIPNAIDKVKAMKGVYYNRTDFNTSVTKVGVLAQEVEAVLPELIVEAPDSGLKSVAYGELTAVLINAVKEQQTVIDDLKSRLETLENN